MEAAGRGPAADLTPLARLLADPYSFDLFQAVRVLLWAATGSPRADDLAVGDRAPVRFRAAVGLGFPASPIADVSVGPTFSDGRPSYEMSVTFLGLTGPSGVLPPHYTETLLRLRPDPDRQTRPVLQDWLDLFNHRLTALFCEAWAKYRPDVAYERAAADVPERDCEFTSAYLSLIGMGTPALRDRVRPPAGLSVRPPEETPASDWSLIVYSGLLARWPRTAVGLEAVLVGYLGVPVVVIQFVGRWLPLPESSQTRLGRLDGNAILGRNAMVGRQTWNIGAVKVRVGPLTGGQFAALLPPDGRDDDAPFTRLTRLVRFYLGPEFDFSVMLVPMAAEVPVTRIGSTDGASQLGRNSWLRAAPVASDPEDASFGG